ncbi:hypothetical protein BLA15945_01752 [Burkholderia lata]|uniref:Uncharacterized protein n=1 Tax=Burkholderia lata (strain ATCC 17760 / DSM 23089 / LMG 22485 / NCIMB 9086 / R18194 / 383) TaxID=482957 RepID=A0A6P2J4X5_BURL3|nr:hypothetical protein BLA15945_01752 [Burkholderia lata]
MDEWTARPLRWYHHSTEALGNYTNQHQKVETWALAY